MVESSQPLVSNKTVKIKIALQSDPDNIWTELEIPRDLEPPRKMTALLYAKDHLCEMIGLKNYLLMFGDELEVNEEKILR